uniref:Uncharacterized protein n=1 Tax=Arundo donax TaxID=35708 RepID=A0A0A8ZMB1_ARUDO
MPYRATTFAIGICSARAITQTNLCAFFHTHGI